MGVVKFAKENYTRFAAVNVINNYHNHYRNHILPRKFHRDMIKNALHEIIAYKYDLQQQVFFIKRKLRKTIRAPDGI